LLGFASAAANTVAALLAAAAGLALGAALA
jgi:hypothetical protein